MSDMTVAVARSRIAKAAKICEGDARVVDFINRATRRLLPRGKWVGTTPRYRICANSDCITWPRQVETIELCAVSGFPIKVRNEWYEFSESGPGIQDANSGLKMVDRGNHCAFADITGGATDRKIKIYSDVNEGTGKYIILLGQDHNGNWIRSKPDGVTWIDGEKIAIPSAAATPVLSTKYFSKLSRVIKDETDGPVRLYEYNTTTSANVRALAYYEPDERIPSYRRSFLPGLSQVHSGSTCDTVSVEVVAKLKFIEVANENDFLIIGNLDALEEETRALCFFDKENFEQAYRCEALAVGYLQTELSSHIGDGPVMQMRVEGANFGAGEIENVQ